MAQLWFSILIPSTAMAEEVCESLLSIATCVSTAAGVSLREQIGTGLTSLNVLANLKPFEDVLGKLELNAYNVQT